MSVCVSIVHGFCCSVVFHHIDMLQFVYSFIYLSAWAAVTKYHILGGLNNRDFLTVLEAGGPRSGCQHGQGSDEDPLPGL